MGVGLGVGVAVLGGMVVGVGMGAVVLGGAAVEVRVGALVGSIGGGPVGVAGLLHADSRAAAVKHRSPTTATR